MNVWDVILVLLIAAVLALAVRKIIHDRKNGKGCLGCGGNCTSCSAGCAGKKEELPR